MALFKVFHLATKLGLQLRSAALAAIECISTQSVSLQRIFTGCQASLKALQSTRKLCIYHQVAFQRELPCCILQAGHNLCLQRIRNHCGTAENEGADTYAKAADISEDIFPIAYLPTDMSETVRIVGNEYHLSLWVLPDYYYSH